MDTVDKARTIDFKFAGVQKDGGGYKDETIKFDFHEKCFEFNNLTNPVTKYNDNLAELCLCMSMASFNSNEKKKDYSDANKNIKGLFDKIGADYFFSDSYEKKPTANSVGVAMGLYPKESPTTLFIVIRSGGYELEWAGNVTVGKHSANNTGTRNEHAGFRMAAVGGRDRDVGKDGYSALQCLGMTIMRHENRFSTVKNVVITGYSRGGAIANILANCLNAMAKDDVIKPFGPPSFKFNKNNFTTYSFEAPRCATNKEIDESKERNKNIWYVVNPNDLVTLFPWDFGKDTSNVDNFSMGRYGNRKGIPSYNLNYKDPSDLNQMRKELQKMLDGTNENDKSLNTAGMKSINPKGFSDSYEWYMQNLIWYLIKIGLQTRDYYCLNFQKPFVDLMKIFYSEQYEKYHFDKIFETIIKQFDISDYKKQQKL